MHEFVLALMVVVWLLPGLEVHDGKIGKGVRGQGGIGGRTKVDMKLKAVDLQKGGGNGPEYVIKVRRRRIREGNFEIGRMAGVWIADVS